MAIPKERGSVRPVTIEGDPDQRTYMAEVRSESPSLKIGTIVWIEFGVTWSTVKGREVKNPGQWRQAVIVENPDGVNTASGVHVRLSPDPKKAPPAAG